MFKFREGVRNGLWVLAIATIACAPPADEIPPSSPEEAGKPTAALEEMVLPTASPEEVGMSSQGLGEIDAMMQRYIDNGKIQGAVTAVLMVQQPTKEVPADFENAIRQAIIE